MKTYKVSFQGKIKGAIGCIYNFVETVEAESALKALLKLYDNYDHIYFPIFTETETETGNG